MTEEQQRELAQFINRNSLEQRCNLPDFLIAEYLSACYGALCHLADVLQLPKPGSKQYARGAEG